MGKGSKIVMVVLESLSGSGHKIVRLRPKLADKKEMIYFDPHVRQRVLYREKKKIRTM